MNYIMLLFITVYPLAWEYALQIKSVTESLLLKNKKTDLDVMNSK